jgi:hypothetical protein
VLAAILAHQGGWDEMLMVAGPIAIFAYILHRANQRAEKAAAAAGDGDVAGNDGLLDRAALLESDDIGPE